MFGRVVQLWTGVSAGRARGVSGSERTERNKHLRFLHYSWFTGRRGKLLTCVLSEDFKKKSGSAKYASVCKVTYVGQSKKTIRRTTLLAETIVIVTNTMEKGPLVAKCDVASASHLHGIPFHVAFCAWHKSAHSRLDCLHAKHVRCEMSGGISIFMWLKGACTDVLENCCFSRENFILADLSTSTSLDSTSHLHLHTPRNNEHTYGEHKFARSTRW